MKRFFWFITFIIILQVLVLSFAGCSKEKSYSMTQTIFGTSITVSLYGENCESVYGKMIETLNEIESNISLTVTDSALKNFNESTDTSECFEIGYHAYNIIEQAIIYYDDTDGYFDITVQPISEIFYVDSNSSNYFSSSEIDFTLPSYDMVLGLKVENQDNNALSPFGIEIYSQDDRYYIKKLSSDVKVDLGAIAKGYGADICIEIAKDYNINSALVNLGGNIKILGQEYKNNSYSDYTIGVNSPRPKTASIRSILFAIECNDELSIVTSGDYERYYDYLYGEEVVPICHIINPKTAMPLGIYYDELTEQYKYDTNSVIACTIIDKNSCLADAYATALCNMGYDDGKNFMATNGIQGAIMTDDKIAFVGDINFYNTGIYNIYKSYEIEQIEIV